MTEQSLYERLGGVYAIAAVVDHFSDRLLKNPKIVNANPQLKEWHTEKYKTRLPGLKFNRTLWVCAVSGGPYEYTAKSLHDAHLDLRITAEVFERCLLSLPARSTTFIYRSAKRMKSWPRLPHKSLM